MKKQQLIHLHGLLGEVRKQYDEWGVEMDLEEYEELGVGPTLINEDKDEHRKAVFELVRGITGNDVFEDALEESVGDQEHADSELQENGETGNGVETEWFGGFQTGTYGAIDIYEEEDRYVIRLSEETESRFVSTRERKIPKKPLALDTLALMLEEERGFDEAYSEVGEEYGADEDVAQEDVRSALYDVLDYQGNIRKSFAKGLRRAIKTEYQGSAEAGA